MQQRERTPLHVVRIVGSQAEDAEPYGNGRPGAWLLVVIWELVFIGLCLWLGWSLPLWWPAP